MSLEFNEDTLIDLCELVTDGSHHSPPSQVKGYYMASVKDMGTYKFNYSDCRKISEEDYNKLVKSGCSPKNDDILIAKDGSPLSNIFIYKEEYPMVLLSSIAIIRANKNKILPEFLKYYLENHSIKRYIQTTYTSGSVIPRIILKDFKKFPIIYPNMENQKKIIGILRIIDKKIAINEEINQNLENIASNIFKRYFLDYAPFQNLTFNESIIGDVPNEWNFIKIKDIVDVRDGTHDSPSAVEVGFPLITSKHLNKYDVNKKEANKISFEDYTNINKRSLVEPFDILISMIGTVGNICYIMYDEIDFAIKNVGLFKTSKNPLLREYLLLYLKSNIVTQYIDSHLAGSTQKYISLTELRNIPIVIPPNEILTDFKDIINPIFNNIKTNNLEINTLINLRDILLPKLMSGEIDVSKINLNYNKD